MQNAIDVWESNSDRFLGSSSEAQISYDLGEEISSEFFSDFSNEFMAFDADLRSLSLNIFLITD